MGKCYWADSTDRFFDKSNLGCVPLGAEIFQVSHSQDRS